METEDNHDVELGLGIQTHSMRRLQQEHRFHVEDTKYKNTWQSGCISLDRRAVQYFTQMGIVGGIMGFSIYQLLTNENNEKQEAYLGLLTLLIGLVLPHPRFQDSPA